MPRTRSYDHLEPISESVIAAKHVSSDTEYQIKYDLITRAPTAANGGHVFVQEADFLACYYDGKIWIGIACEIDDEHKDIGVTSMNPAFPSTSFHWPSREDRCYVPDTHILCRIEAPITMTGRQYHITEAGLNRIKAGVQKLEMLKVSL